jgi:hypothetical protein
MVLAMLVFGFVPHVDASFSSSEAVNFSSNLRAGDTEKIRIVLENKLLTQRLQDLGYTSQEVTARLSSLSDSQIHCMAQKLDDVKVGQDSSGVIIVLLVVIIGVLVYLQVTGQKVIVTK